MLKKRVALIFHFFLFYLMLNAKIHMSLSHNSFIKFLPLIVLFMLSHNIGSFMLYFVQSHLIPYYLYPPKYLRLLYNWSKILEFLYFINKVDFWVLHVINLFVWIFTIIKKIQQRKRYVLCFSEVVEYILH